MKGKLILENGKIFEGKIFGELKDSIGDIYFNTSMSGYEEIITDPATAGTMMVMTYPMIGNYGINIEDMESDKVQLKALIIKEDAKLPNNFRCEMTLEGFLRQYGVVGFKGLDTRYLTQTIREYGSMKAIITSEELTKKEIHERFEKYSNKKIALTVGTDKKYEIKNGGKKIGVLDLGVKKSTLEYLKNKNFHTVVFPALTSAEDILLENLDGLIISNGPGNPNELAEVIENIKKLVGKLQMFGETLGIQLLALALEGKVEKLKYGHRGSYAVKNLKTEKVVITTQNSGYVITEIPKNTNITYQGINVKTIEGIENKELKIRGTQFTPDLYEEEKDELIKFLKEI